MTTEEIHIFGAGIFGLATAFCLAERGARVTVIDPKGVGAGASGGIIGALAPHTPDQWDEKKAFQFESLKISADFWTRVERIAGQKTGYARTGRLQPLEDARAVALGRARKADALKNWGDFARWDVVRCSDFPCWAVHGAGEWAVFDTLSALIHPRAAVFALATAIERMGGKMVQTPPNRPARQLWATGYEGLAQLELELKRPVGNGVKGQALLFEADLSKAPQLFAGALHFIPHTNATLGVGSTSERYFDAPDMPDGALDTLYGEAVALLPSLKECKVLERWAGCRPRALTRSPLLGRHPHREDVFIANGGFKIGFGVAPKVAGIMCELMLEGSDHIPDPFRLS